MAMRKISKFVLGMVLMLGALWALSPAMAEDLRLGVISSGNTRAVADVLSVELSKNDSIHLLERDAIDKLVGEAKLTAMLGKEEYAKLGSLIGAEALILLSDGGEKDKGAAARLVAVAPGAVLSWVALPADTVDPGVAAIRLKHAFLPCLDKIRRMNAGQVIPVSLLGLRFELDTPDSVRLERELNTLLAQNLSRLSSVIVLERWDLLKLMWEKDISSNNEKSFWSTSMLIDGRIKRNKDKLDIEVRLRSSQADDGAWLSLSGKVDHMPAVVESLTGQILKKLDRVPEEKRWDLRVEAGNYALLGQWAHVNGLNSDAVSALETAQALGYGGKSGKVYLIYAYLGLLGEIKQHSLNEAEKLVASVDALSQALDMLSSVTALPKNFDYTEPDGMRCPRLQAQERYQIFKIVMEIMGKAYKSRYYVDFPYKLEHMRRMLRTSQKQYTADYDLDPWWVALAPYWTDSPEETIQVYRKALTMRRMNPVIRFDISANHESRKRILAWNPADEPRLKGLWQAFLDELLNADDPQNQADGIMFKYLDQESLDARHAMLPEIYAFLNSHTNLLVGSNAPPFFESFMRPLIDSFRAPVSDEIRHRRFEFAQFAIRKVLDFQLLVSFMNPPTGWGRLDMWSPEEAAALTSLIDERTAEIEQSGPMSLVAENALRSLGEWKNHLAPYLSGFAKTTSPKIPPGALILKHYITFREAFRLDHDEAYTDIRFSVDGGIWLTAFRDGKIFIMDTATGDHMAIPEPVTPASDSSSGPKITSLNLMDGYVFLGRLDGVWKYTRKSGKWTRLNLPQDGYGVRAFNNTLYLLFNKGVLAVDPVDDSIRTLISTRRNPPKTLFDNSGFNNPTDIFPGLHNRLTVHTEAHLDCECMDGSDTWRKLDPGTFPLPVWPKIRFDPKGVLFSNSIIMFDGLMYFAHSADTPEWLLRPSRIGKRTDPAKDREKSHARWICPETLLADTHGDGPGIYAAAMHKDTLWILSEGVKQDGGLARLHIFRKGETQGKSMPIYLDLSGTGLDASSRPNYPGDGLHDDYFFHSELLILSEGVAISVKGGQAGKVWYIPFSDLPKDWRD